jgi:UDP-3-O-[3-hydroxymyristoyl] glucosamine N-acyltransferase
VLHHGVAVGQDGFGFHHGPGGEVIKRPQLRRVVIGDDVVGLYKLNPADPYP